jgi:lipopolysaccharide/colanic/teichoic acid biosynthesis glycosyltransferase
MMTKKLIQTESHVKSKAENSVCDAWSARLLAEPQFRQMLSRERKRSERSRSHLLLMLVGLKNLPERERVKDLPKQIAASVCHVVRDTDLVGWFEEGNVLGAIFTELGKSGESSGADIIESKVTTALRKSIKKNFFEQLEISFYVFPEHGGGNGRMRAGSEVLYPDLSESARERKLSFALKRGIDVVGSAAALLFLSPIFAALAIAIKLTSKGPVLFCQERVGLYGVPFVFFKFRSMHVATKDDIHKEFVQKFIAGKTESSNGGGKEKVVYKITNHPRVTWIGKFMRRTSLDEIPQFWNVLKGEMSLVGPRPPIPYEMETYDIWHRRRMFVAKPGITGLWQVHGRSKTTFDDMVRMDLHYSKNWSLSLDVKILLQTPRALFSGDGAH